MRLVSVGWSNYGYFISSAVRFSPWVNDEGFKLEESHKMFKNFARVIIID